MENNAGFEWDDSYLLGHPAMDDTHREFVDCVQALLTVDDGGLAEALQAFASHAERHFGEEDRWMETSGFPAAGCHADEHAKVMASVREVQRLLAEGDCAIVRELAEALVEWFPNHADYMDSALAAWLVKRGHGGAPLVFRRGRPKGAESRL